MNTPASQKQAKKIQLNVKKKNQLLVIEPNSNTAKDKTKLTSFFSNLFTKRKRHIQLWSK